MCTTLLSRRTSRRARSGRSSRWRFTPFAWLLEIGDPSDRQAVDAASWTEIASEEGRELELVTTVGSIVTAIGGDYRHRWQIVPDSELAEADQEAAPSP